MITSNIKFYYNFFYEYLNLKFIDFVCNYLQIVPYYHNDKLHINYIHRGDSYQIVVPPNARRICPFKKVETHVPRPDELSALSVHEEIGSDEYIPNVETFECIDVTRDIKKKIGPHFDFHNIPTSPGLLGYKNLVFYKRNGDKIKYSETSIINL